MKTLNLVKTALILSILLSGCGANQTSSADSTEIDQLKKQINDLTAENQKLKDQLKEKDQLKANETSTKSESPSEEQPATIVLNQPLTIPDFAEISLKKVSFTTKVTPPTPDGFYNYYEVKDPANIYYDVVVDVKSLLPMGKTSDEFVSVKVKYDSKYEYNSFPTIEVSGGGDFTYTNITTIEPLKTGTLHYIAELPVEISKDQKPLEVIFTSNGKDYVYKAR